MRIHQNVTVIALGLACLSSFGPIRPNPFGTAIFGTCGMAMALVGWEFYERRWADWVQAMAKFIACGHPVLRARGSSFLAWRLFIPADAAYIIIALPILPPAQARGRSGVAGIEAKKFPMGLAALALCLAHI